MIFVGVGEHEPDDVAPLFDQITNVGQDEIDEKSLVGLQGVVKIGHVGVNGTTFVNLEGFASATQWKELSAVVSPPSAAGSEVA
jgi:hypothetical protein